MAGRMIARLDDADYFGTDKGRGTPIVFLHGAMSDHSIWDRQAARLRSRYRIICPDFRGHGQSNGSCHDLTTCRLADDLLKVVEAMSLDEPPIIVGWSLGASVALTACLKGLLAKGLVLVGATPQLVSDDRFPFGMATADARARDAGLNHNFKKNARLFGHIVSPENAEVGEKIAGLAENASRSVALSLFASSWTESLVSDLHKISTPACIIHGAEDTICSPNAAAYLAEHLPNVLDVNMIEGAGHAPFLTRVEHFDYSLDRALRAFEIDAPSKEPYRF